MSKLDQLKALGDAKRASRKSSGGSVESRHTPERISPSKEERPPRPPLHMAKAVLGNSQAVGMGKKTARVAPSPPEAKSKLRRGRPKITDKRPWEQEGISRRTWYRRNSPTRHLMDRGGPKE